MSRLSPGDYGALRINAKGQPEIHLHPGQALAADSTRRITGMMAGAQSGKTSYGPWWVWNQVKRAKGGDHLIVTANYDLFKLALLPKLQEAFEDVLEIGRYWPSDRTMEICDGAQPGGKFLAQKSTDRMYARLILRSADAPSGLESTTAQSAWLDEAGQESFSLSAWKAVRRRVSISHGPILITTTLYYNGWLIQQVIKKAEDGGKVANYSLGEGQITVTDNASANICLIQFDSIINPLFPMDEYEAARSTMPDDEFQMFYRGRVATAANLIYSCFSWEQHTCPPFLIGPKWKILLGLDFGGVNTAALICAEEPSTGRIYVIAEYHAGNRLARDHVREILDLCPRFPYAIFGGSGSEGQWRSEFSAAGLPVTEPAISDVQLGISTVYGQIKSDALIIFRSCEETLDQLGRYRRKRGRDGTPTAEIEDKASFHLLDAMRYLLGSVRGEKRVWSISMRS